MSARLTSAPHSTYRPDIDGLRAIAVLSVVVYHAFPALLTGGFIGVDIFFVISGYLISLALMEQIEQGRFSLWDFYSRRIRRIFPALITVLVACFAFAWFWLLSDDFMNLGRHIAAGAVFMSNFVLWSESGYFDASAETKPLLHLWSLGIEEQFYIVWPVLLWAAWKLRISLLWLTMGVGMVSFAWNVHNIELDATATFYSPLTRAWELLCGAVLAWWSIHKARGTTANATGPDHGPIKARFFEQGLATAGLILLVIGFFHVRDTLPFPGYWAALPVLGAVFVISAGPNAWFNRYVLANPVAVWFGLISYPLYLWHWPLLSFSRMIFFKGVSNAYLIGMVVLSIVLAWLTYRLIEKPIRFHAKPVRAVPMLLAALFLMGGAGFWVMKYKGVPNQPGRLDAKMSKNLELIGPNFGLHRDCVPDRTLNSEKCVHGENPDLYLWGDSHAMHFAEALRAQDESRGFRQQSMTACAPILDATLLTPPRFTEAWGLTCIQHNRNVFDWLSAQKSYQYVVLASPFRLGKQLLTTDGLVDSNKDLYLSYLQRTVQKLRSQGFKPIIIAPAPAAGYNMGRCWARMSLHDQERYCDFELKNAPQAVIDTDEMMSAATQFAPVVFLRDYICSDGYCRTSIDGIPLYRDAGHFSTQGSRLLGTQHDFSRILREQADAYWKAKE